VVDHQAAHHHVEDIVRCGEPLGDAFLVRAVVEGGETPSLAESTRVTDQEDTTSRPEMVGEFVHVRSPPSLDSGHAGRSPDCCASSPWQFCSTHCRDEFTAEPAQFLEWLGA
jgi:hypothetical protein